MDPVSVLGLTAGLVQLIGTVAKTVQYLNNVKDATQDRARMATEIATLLGLLTSLRNKVELANQEDPWFMNVRALGGTGGPLEQYKNGLEKLAKKFKGGTGMKGVTQRLVWTLDKKQVEETLNMMGRLKLHISIALQEDNL